MASTDFNLYNNNLLEFFKLQHPTYRAGLPFCGEIWTYLAYM